MVVRITASFFGDRASSARILFLGQDLKKRADRAVPAVAKKAVTAAKGNVRVDSRNLQDSIGWAPVGTSNGAGARVGTGAPYGRRIEFDFKGPDSRNRTFDHVTLPAAWLGPVADQVGPWLVAEMRR